MAWWKLLEKDVVKNKWSEAKQAIQRETRVAMVGIGEGKPYQYRTEKGARRTLLSVSRRRTLLSVSREVALPGVVDPRAQAV